MPPSLKEFGPNSAVTVRGSSVSDWVSPNIVLGGLFFSRRRYIIAVIRYELYSGTGDGLHCRGVSLQEVLSLSQTYMASGYRQGSALTYQSGSLWTYCCLCAGSGSHLRESGLDSVGSLPGFEKLP